MTTFADKITIIIYASTQEAYFFTQRHTEKERFLFTFAREKRLFGYE